VMIHFDFMLSDQEAEDLMTMVNDSIVKHNAERLKLTVKGSDTQLINARIEYLEDIITKVQCTKVVEKGVTVSHAPMECCGVNAHHYCFTCLRCEENFCTNCKPIEEIADICMNCKIYMVCKNCTRPGGGCIDCSEEPY